MRTLIIIFFIFKVAGVLFGSEHRTIRKKRSWIINSFDMEEESPGPFPYMLGTVTLEQEHLLKFYLRGMGVDEEPKGVLKIDHRTGEVFVHKKVDYETYPFLSLRFEARDGRHNVDTELGIEIRIRDINDHAPVFSKTYYETIVDESVHQGEIVTRVSASDDDDSNTANGFFGFTLVSVTPKTDNVEFYITQNNGIGSISFKGCLDYEKAQKYTLLIEAKDSGEKIQLSSTTTVVLNVMDRNNHPPEITGQTGPGKVKELETGVEVLRLQVGDDDDPRSLASKAKFTLHGDPENYFEIHADGNTNEGILTVVKAMDYETQTSRNVSITVQNEEDYFSCKVKTRSSEGLWDLETRKGPGSSVPYTVTIAVEDINDPPEFVPRVREIFVQENTYIKTTLETLTARDPDRIYGNSFHFLKGEDKDNWVNIDPETGDVSMAKMADRESPYVKNNTYSVTVYVVDDDQPPKTGTGTLVIYVSDQNDNVPLLKEKTFSMCLSDKETRATITAVDQDLPPFSAPFHYKLLGDVKGKWRIDPEYGTTVSLVREKAVYSGHYQIQIEILDNQGFGLVHNLSVTVCNCTITPNCHVRRSFTARPSLSFVGIILLAFIILLVIPLMTFSRKINSPKRNFQDDDAPNCTLMKSNLEAPGTDCKISTLEFHSSVGKIRQKRTWVVDIFTMKRGFKGSLGPLTFYVNIEDCFIYGPGLDKHPVGLFHINKVTKEMDVTGNVDYDGIKNFSLVFECASLKHVYERLAVEIIVEEVYEPYFLKGTYIISAEESTLQGTNLLTLHAPNKTHSKALTHNLKVTPNQHNVMFVLNEKRELSFHGCLDYEENKQFTVVIEAKDQQILNPHSSTATVIINIIDKNNHKPVITGKTGNGRVKERETGAEVYRIQVSDKDSPGSPAWRAKCKLYGEKAENFQIETDPKTNEGILTVVKPLDFEESPTLNLTVEVKNEEPFFSCSVRKMRYDGQLWDVEFSRNGSSSATLSFPVTVEDVNEPPEFTESVKHVTVVENTPPGYTLWTFNVTDQDQNPPNTHRFIKGKDIDNWVTVDSKTGRVSTAKVLDRESVFVMNDTYTVILHAVDDGIPWQTGTGTLIIHLLDQNDNAPLLMNSKVTVCLPESIINITATDPDLPPFSAPFTYKVQDDKGRWKIEPPQGETVSLVKDASVFSGSYELILDIADAGGLSSTQKLSVTVRSCTGETRGYAKQAGATGTFIIFLSLLLILCALLMVFKCSWGSNNSEKTPFPEDSNAFVCSYNDEGPGCDVEEKLQKKLARTPSKRSDINGQVVIKKKLTDYQKHQELIKLIEFYHHTELQYKESWERYEKALKSTSSADSLSQTWVILNSMIEKKLLSLHDEGKELSHYKPRPYNDEGEPGDLAELDTITLADSNFNLENLENLQILKFQRLAAKCRPDLVEQSYRSRSSSSSSSFSINHGGWK